MILNYKIDRNGGNKVDKDALSNYNLILLMGDNDSDFEIIQ